jgi:DNA-binding transcriptional ArsR family regulator
MNADLSLGDAASLISDPARSAILTALLSGRAHTAGELALAANISAQNASGHLQKLLRGNLVAVETIGRNRLYRMASPDVGIALEAIAVISSKADSRFKPLSRPISELRFCRTCYGHLAGIVAVSMTRFLLSHGMIHEREREFTISSSGDRFFTSLGIDLKTLRTQRRSFARRCLDWTEREPHIAGSLGNAIYVRFTTLGYIAPIRGSRAVRVTSKGRAALASDFELQFNGIRMPSAGNSRFP